jgi:hypothetical protein
MAKSLRIPLVETVEQRQPDVNKDGLAKNVFYDVNTKNETYATKRPGFEVLITGSGSPIGSSEYAWGIYNYELPIREIVNGNVVIGDPINLLFDFKQTSQGSNSGISMGMSAFPTTSSPSPTTLPTPKNAVPNPSDTVPPPTETPVSSGGDPNSGEGATSTISNSTAAPIPVITPTPLFIDPVSGGIVDGISPPEGNTILGTWRLHQVSGAYTINTISGSTCTGTTTGPLSPLPTISDIYVVENVFRVEVDNVYVTLSCGTFISSWRWKVTRYIHPDYTTPVVTYYTPFTSSSGIRTWEPTWISLWIAY